MTSKPKPPRKRINRLLNKHGLSLMDIIKSPRPLDMRLEAVKMLYEQIDREKAYLEKLERKKKGKSQIINI